MMGFDDPQVHSDVLDNSRTDIMDSTSNAIVNVLNSSERRSIIRLLRGSSSSSDKVSEDLSSSSIVETLNMERHILEKLTISTENNNGVEHKFYKDQECDESFTKSEKCIIVVSEVTLESKIEQSQQTVNESVLTSIKSSMSDDSFRNEVNEDEVKEVKYINDGYNVLLPVPGGIDGVGGGSIAAITIGSVLFLVAIAFFVRRGRAGAENYVKANDDFDSDDSDMENSDSEDLEKMDANKFEPDIVVSKDLPMAGEHEVESEILMTGSGLQMDLETGQPVGTNNASMGYTSSSFRSGSSGYSADNSDSLIKTMDEGQLVSRLDHAVHAGDWETVANIAADLSEADNLSEMSSRYSSAGDISYDPSERDSTLSSLDAKRAKQIDEFIQKGDWKAVGDTAVAFASLGSSIASGSPELKKPSVVVNNSYKRKTLLDFIAGPWNSTKYESENSSIAAVDAMDPQDESNGMFDIGDIILGLLSMKLNKTFSSPRFYFHS